MEKVTYQAVRSLFVGTLVALTLIACQKSEVKVKCAPYTLRLQVISRKLSA